MAATGYGTERMKDLIAGTAGGVAGAISPNLNTATQAAQKSAIYNTYAGQKNVLNYARQQRDFDRQFDQGIRQLPQAYNQRGMVDSGQMQRGGQEMLRGYGRASGDLRQDLDIALQGLAIDDLSTEYDLSELRQVLGSQRFQEAIAKALSSQGMS
jgi:hypothetical protein